MLNFSNANFEMITELMEGGILKNKNICPKCNHPCNLVKYKKIRMVTLNDVILNYVVI